MLSLLLALAAACSADGASRPVPRRVERPALPALAKPAPGLAGSIPGAAVALADEERGSVRRFARALEGPAAPAPASPDAEAEARPRTARFASAERAVLSARAAAAALLPPVEALLPVAPFYDPGHWRAELVPDARYGRLLQEAVRRLAPGDRAESAGRSRELQARRDVLSAMREKDPLVHSHMMRVGLLAGLLAWELGYPEDFAQNAAWAARVHDLGKLDDGILAVVNLRRPLDEGERRLMQAHTMIGAKLVLAERSLDKASRRVGARAALSHHEAWDGTGYPAGAPGAAVPLVARLTTVADFFDALMENRPYRAGMTAEQALAIMERESAKFDPDAWRALRRLVGTR